MDIPSERVPAHVAIIMDGNGRWAKQRGLPRTKGHEMGERALFDVVEGALEASIRYLSVYSFSTENWNRPAEEVDFLMNFNRALLRQRRDELNERRVRIRRIGRRELVPADVLEEFDEAERRTAHHDRMDLLTCFNYGGRAEIEDAVRLATEGGKGASGGISEHLYAPDVPDVDLLIRTSGEMRLSNFLLWQSAYAELYFTDTLWPDFDRHSLFDALRDYAARNRRFGGL
ncbi:MAG: polyprenyl diphosphate synthase [Actinomycetota bacterium]|nr:polyprenyl diphosphate synthase [Actinomycetota bacterium]